MKKWAFPIVVLQFVFGVFFVAPYTQYHSEKTLKESAQKSLEDKSPKLDGFIHRSLITEEPGTTNTLIFIDVNVSNSGHDSSPADQYEFRPNSSKNSSTNCETLNFPDEYKLNFFINGKSWQLDLKRTQLISEKTVKTISNGESPRGWLAFRARGMTPGQLQQTNFVISFFDINGNLISVTNGFWKGRHAKFTQSSLEDLTADIPGAEKIFYPVEPPARTNWMPPELPQGCSNIVVFFGAMPQFLSRQMAEAADINGAVFQIKDLPDSLLENADKSPNYSRRKRDMWIKTRASISIGGKTFIHPIQPIVVSNRLYIEVDVPFSNEKRKVVMSDAFGSELPIPKDWDVNFSTNYDGYGNGIYAFEVVNELTNPVLQVSYASPNEVFVNGIFQVDSNSILAAFNEQPLLATIQFGVIDTNQGLMTASLQFENFHETLIIHSNETIASFGQRFTNELFRPIFKFQRPIFKYPSNRNLGAFAEYPVGTNNSDTNIFDAHK